MTAQLALPLPARAALARGDFFVAPANALAVARVDAWRDWPGGKLVLSGPEGSGKTHLAHVWAADSGARIVPARDLAGADIPALATGPLAVEDVPAIAGDRDGEEALFHLHNLTLAGGHALLLTGRAAPAHWPLGLADLKSRLMGAERATLDAPDDALLSVVLAKQFADRQIVPTPTVIPYLVSHMPRSFAMARRIVAMLDRQGLANARPINRDLARDILAAETGAAVTSLSHAAAKDAP